ncbi:MAG: hypothetical protein MUO63_01075 [Desulfobulbaceae bacterium]|nr:hypothetical protein [Desulfobulbaceae bacterium]
MKNNASLGVHQADWTIRRQMRKNYHFSKLGVTASGKQCYKQCYDDWVMTDLSLVPDQLKRFPLDFSG